jgi:hypothetical protein
MNSEEFKKMRWVKLARKKGIPYFEEFPTLNPFPLESIKCDLIELTPIVKRADRNPQLARDKLTLLGDWKEDYMWDLVSREVALAWHQIRSFGWFDPRKVKAIWRELLRTGTNSTLQERMGRQVRSLVVQYQEQEWNRLMKGLRQYREKDRYFDCKMATLVYYNDDISGKEMERRWSMLDQRVVQRTIPDCVALSQAPRQESWHRKADIAFTDEMWDSVCDNWWDNPMFEVMDTNLIFQRDVRHVNSLCLFLWFLPRPPWSPDLVGKFASLSVHPHHVPVLGVLIRIQFFIVHSPIR